MRPISVSVCPHVFPSRRIDGVEIARAEIEQIDAGLKSRTKRSPSADTMPSRSMRRLLLIKRANERSVSRSTPPRRSRQTQRKADTQAMDQRRADTHPDGIMSGNRLDLE
jgi:hypothetical protein